MSGSALKILFTWIKDIVSFLSVTSIKVYISSTWLESSAANKNLAYLLFFRLQPGIPTQVGTLIPILFNINVKKIFFSNIFGVAPGIFISVSLVSGISSKIEEGVQFNLDLLSDPKVSIPLTALGVMVLVVNFIKQKFFKSKIWIHFLKIVF